LRAFRNPRRPTVSTLKDYGTIINLVQSWYTQHHELVDGISLKRAKEGAIIGCSSAKNMFSKIIKIHLRVNDRIRQVHGIDCEVEDRAKREEAALWLDANERKEMTMGSYLKFIVRTNETYSGNKRTRNNNL
jgi:hypothetical protein